MKKKSSLFLLIATLVMLLATPFSTQAAWLKNEKIEVTQPNGTVIHCFATGDEFYNWLHDAQNYTIIQSETDGFYYYAQLMNGQLVPSALKVGEGNPEAFGLTPSANISAQQMKARREFMQQEMRFYEPNRAYGRAEGTLNNLVMYIRFSDQDEFTSDTMVDYNRFNSTAPNANSMVNYYQEVSYGQLHLPSTFYPKTTDAFVRSYQDTFPRSYYMPYNSVTNPNGYQTDSDRTNREHTLLANTVAYINLNSPVPESIDLDYNNDGNVDNVVFIVKGGPTAWSTLLWPHRWSLYTQDAFINGKRVFDFNFQLETSLNSSGVGVLCHEMFHSLGAPDLYRYETTDITPVGPWDVMASNNNPPQYMGAFMKYKYGGWIEDIPWITESGTYTLNPLQSNENNAYRIHSSNSSSQYFLIEFRKKDGTFDGTLSKSGMLIYRINPNAGNGNASGPPDEVYIFRPNGSPTSSGSLNEAMFAANYGRTAFDNTTNPYPFLQNGTAGGVYISDISSIGETMSFKVDFPGTVEAQIEASVRVACQNDPVQLFDASVGLPSSWQWSISPNTFTFLNGTNATSKDPVVAFNNLGDYTISLTSSNSYGTSTVEMTDLIHIGSEAGYFTDDFESASLSQGSWKVENPDNDVTWNIFPTNGNGGSMSAGINFRAYFAINQRDRLVSMPFDLSGMSSAYLSFEHAYAQNAAYTQVSDSLIVLVSADCGLNWQRIATYGENGNGSFATHLPATETFFPQSATDWCGSGWGSPCYTLDLSPWAGMTDVRIAFESVSFYGNPLMLDNIVVSQFVGLENSTEKPQLSLSPNPSQGSFSLHTLDGQHYETVTVLDGHGRLVAAYPWKKSMLLNENQQWESGVYTLLIAGDDRQIVKKMVVQ